MVGSWADYRAAHPDEDTAIVAAYHVDGKHFLFTAGQVYLFYNDKITKVQVRWED